ncbi:MAG: glycerol-3-phosphate dehydrogenase/oxidase [Chloroflexi bacterium]|nr:glycerol-3-phosphate dehydrogenase/oxidase [Chloroflexota bacterium]
MLGNRQSLNADQTWDLLVVGGGITGAGILREAAQAGLAVLLVEQRDFASGTSSRSSKLVHGGLRYLNNFQFGLTWQSVHARDALLAVGEGLIEPLPFVYPIYHKDKMPAWLVEFGLYMYGWMGGQWRVHQRVGRDEVALASPDLSDSDLTGAFRFYDAQTDDARLVLRVLREGMEAGGQAVNYARVQRLLRDADGTVSGAVIDDQVSGAQVEIKARAVVNATGVWADGLRNGDARLRPLRGSHLIFRQDRFPLYQAVSFPHPDDGRPVFAFPWEGVTLLGTTDLDHEADLDEEPAISPEELDYLLRAVQGHFPLLNLTIDDVLVTFAGVRPVLDTEAADNPSEASREHAIWLEDGLLTVTGGKLTTFRSMAHEALDRLRAQVRDFAVNKNKAGLNRLPPLEHIPAGLSRWEAQRLQARYGPAIVDFVCQMPLDDRRRVDGLPIHWLEFTWAARHEAVVTLSDLLLRRVRIGLLSANGGEKYLPRIRQLVQAELGWDDARWLEEETAYLEQWHAKHSVPVQAR